MRLRSVLVTGALLAGSLGLQGCGDTVRTAGPVDSGDCPREAAVVRRALERSTLRADVSGDGRLDRVAAATDQGAAKPCRAFVAVRVHGGSTYSTHLFAAAVPVEGLRAQVVGLPELGDAPGAEIVVDTKAAVDSLLAQMFTLVGGRLRVVRAPGLRDGTFIVDGGGVVFPRGAGCTPDGRLVLSDASLSEDGKHFRVARRTYDVRGVRLRLVDPAVRATVPASRLTALFPEFARPHWGVCAGTVRR